VARYPYRLDGSMPIWRVDAFCAKHGAAANINRETKETTRILFIFADLPLDPSLNLLCGRQDGRMRRLFEMD
jgi:hypothetical protein